VTAILKAQVPVLEQLVALTPNETLLYIRLGEAALAVNERQTAIDAFETFLELAPEDPNAPAVRQRLRLLRSTSDVVTG
jgi:predicted TPR repeat methyltransferase